MESMNQKSRELSIGDFLRLLQMEFFTHRLRSLFYDYEEFRKMNSDIAEKKKVKIMSLGERIGCPTIFDNNNVMDQMYYYQFLNPYGLPNLQYGKNKDAVRKWDCKSFCKQNTEVVYKGQLCRIAANNADVEELILIPDGMNRISLPYTYVEFTGLLEIDAYELR